MTVAPVAAAAVAAPRDEAVERARTAAREFEAVFVRQMLAPLERAGGMGKRGGTSQGVYGSFVVGALAEAATQGRGLGLADVVMRALIDQSSMKSNT